MILLIVYHSNTDMAVNSVYHGQTGIFVQGVKNGLTGKILYIV